MTLLRYVGVVAMFFCVGAIEKRQGPGRGVLMPDFFPPAVPSRGGRPVSEVGQAHAWVELTLTYSCTYL